VLSLSHNVCARSSPSPSCTTTMAESPAHRPDLLSGGKYRLGKKIGSGSCGMCCCCLTNVCACSPPSPSCTTTTAESPAHRPDLRVGGKYRHGKNISSGSFGMCCHYLMTFALTHPPHLPALQPWQKVSLTDLISSPAASIGSERRLAWVLAVCAVAVSQTFALAQPPHLPVLQQKVLLTDLISVLAASIGSERTLALVILVCAVAIS